MGASTLSQARHDTSEDEQGHEVQVKPATRPPAAVAAAAAAAAPKHDAEDRRQAATTCSSPACRHSPMAAALAVAASAVGVVVYFALRRWLRPRSGGSGAVQRAAVTKQQVFSVLLAPSEPSAALPPPPTAASALAGSRLVLSDRLDVRSLETRFGCDAWKDGRPPAPHSYWPVDALVAAGATTTATVFSEPLGLGPLLSLSGGSTPNPAGRGFTHGGGDYGAAVSVAGGLADLALAVDELGSARVPAACCGAFALRATAGVLPLEGASTASASLAAPTLLAADASVLLKAGQALRLPGGGAATEVPRYLVAEDFFAACSEEMRCMLPAVVAAVKRWAGPGQAQALSLCDWLFHRVESLQDFLPQLQSAGEETKQQRAERVLQALADAADALRQREFVQHHGGWVDAHREQLPAEVAEWRQQAQQVDEERYRQAQGVAAELRGAMRDALKDGYVFVLPTTPGPAPPAAAQGGAARQAGASEGPAGFRQRCLQFAALASLSGVPAATLPLPVPGSMPLGITLLALHRTDLALAQAAVKLGPRLAEEAAVLAQEQRQAADRPGTQRAATEAHTAGSSAGAAGNGARAAGGTKSSSGASASAARQNGSGAGPAAPAVSEEAAAAALACKERGNAAFQAGRYDEAVRQYSAAIHLDPRCAVYYSNRAMAHLKLMRYADAEADCNDALKRQLSTKSLLRRGSALLAQGKIAGAQADFRQVLALEPGNRQAREELTRIRALGGAGSDAGGDLGSSLQAEFFAAGNLSSAL